MKVKVNRYCLRHKGKSYKAGRVVEIENEELARKIVANSGGDFSVYHPEDDGELVTDGIPDGTKREPENKIEKEPVKSLEEGTAGGGIGEGSGELPDPDVDGSVNP